MSTHSAGRGIAVVIIVAMLLPTDSVVIAASLGVAEPAPFGHAVPGDEEVIFQSPEEALSADLKLVADARGWTLAEAKAFYEGEQAVERIAEAVASRWPEVFVGTALSSDPMGAPSLIIKGSASDALLELVAPSRASIEIVDDQPYSFAELQDRKHEVHSALLALGFVEVVTSSNALSAGRITVKLMTEPTLPSSVSEILAAVPAELRPSVDLTLHHRPIVVAETAFGGMTLLDGGFLECTSGWTVQVEGGLTRGISGAGHCVGVDQVAHASPSHNHPTTFKQQHEGQWGDVEWYTTNVGEPDDFYADDSLIRDVSSVEPIANLSIGEPVCVYGRASFTRDCSLDVLDPSIECGNLNRIVQMNGDTQIGGDSGGPWYFGNEAYGGHFGNCFGLDSFTLASNFDEALGVFVPIN
jgi:streptogrisin C